MNSFRSNGYQIIKQLITPATVINLRQAIADTIESQSDYGVRQLHHRISLVDELANSELITNILRQQTNHAQFRLIKAIYFIEPPVAKSEGFPYRLLAMLVRTRQTAITGLFTYRSSYGF